MVIAVWLCGLLCVVFFCCCVLNWFGFVPFCFLVASVGMSFTYSFNSIVIPLFCDWYY